MKEFADTESAAGGFTTIEEYFQALLCKEHRRKLDAKVQKMIEEGLASEAIEWNEHTLQNMKNEIARKHAQRQES